MMQPVTPKEWLLFAPFALVVIACLVFAGWKFIQIIEATEVDIKADDEVARHLVNEEMKGQPE